MAPEETTETDGQVETKVADDAAQVEIGWADDLMKDFKPEGVDDKGNGETVDEPVAEPVADTAEAKPDETAIEPDSISEADYARNVAIKNEDGSVSYKTVWQLIDEGMYEKDYRHKTQELTRQRGQLEEDRGILNLLDQDEHARKYLLKRIDDIKSGKTTSQGDIEVPDDVFEQLPWLKDIVNKVKEHDVEVHKYRTTQERTQADQTVGKINSVMNAALTAVEKDTGLKLEPGVFRARVGKNILESLEDSVPEGDRTAVVGQMMLVDKSYFLSKARESYQQEIELAKEKAIDSAKQDRAQKARKPTPLKGGGTSAPTGELTEFKMVKDKDGRPDLGAFLDSAFTKGGKG